MSNAMVHKNRLNIERWHGLVSLGVRCAVIGFLLAITMLMAPNRALAQLSTEDQPLSIDGNTPVVARVYFENTDQLNRLAADLDIWEVDHEDGSFVALLSADQHEQVIDAGLHVTVLPEPTAEVINAPVRAQWLRSAGVGEAQDEGIPFYPCYRTVEETYADLADLAAAHPDLASWNDIGESSDKSTPGGAAGYDLNALVLTNVAIPGPKPRLAVMAAIHAREYTTAELATRFVEHLVAQYGVDADITWLLDYTELHLIPIANPDGRKWAEDGYSWRKNTHDSMTCGIPDEVGLNVNEGVDLNRNSSFKWDGCTTYGCSSGYACYLTYRGESPASEPETQVIEDYLRTLFPDRRGPSDADAAPSDTDGLFISLHSYSELILFPWGWTDVSPPNGAALQTLGRKFGHYTGYEVCQVSESDCLYLADGTTDDWSYGELGVASYTFELGTAFFQSCSVFENQILDRSIDALIYAMKAARRPYETPGGPEIGSLDVKIEAMAPIEPPRASSTTIRIEAGDLLSLVAVADDTRSASHGHGEEPAQAITAARYTIDAPSWITGTITYPMEVTALEIGASETITASPVAEIGATVDTTGWALGRHLLMVEAQDATGQWGVPSAIAVHLFDPDAEPQRFYFPFVR